MALAMYRAGASLQEIESMSGKIKMRVGDFKFVTLCSSTIHDQLHSGKRKRLPRWEWVASLITTLRVLAAGRERNPENIGTLAEWKLKYDAAQARYRACGATVDDAAPPSRADAALAEHLAASLAIHGADGGALRGTASSAPVEDPEETWRAGLLELAMRTYAGRWWPDRYTDVISDSFAPYLSLEPAARVIQGYETQFIHGLLQCPEYAEAVIRLEHGDAPADQIKRRLELRMLRQKILYRPNPPNLWVVLDETTLRREYGGPRVLRAQIRHLITMIELPNVTVQVLTFDKDGGCLPSEGPVAVLRFLESHVRDVVFRESSSGGSYPTDEAIIDYWVVALDRLSVRAQQPHATREILERRLREI
ncbi:DUF5753 domain-containing protein [Actinomadura decatromicini]|nr:DUF5753 domain-containing protein [Actinomadura decatromicini]